VSITYRGNKLTIGDGVDFGYEVEKTTLTSSAGDKIVIPRRGVTTFVVSLPFLDYKNLAELVVLDTEFLSKNVENFEALLVLPEGVSCPNLSFFKTVYDEACEFGDEFGVRIEDGELAKRFAKALFIMSRDNMLYYKEVCKDIEDGFNEDKLFIYINKALNVYTGTGCH